MNKYLAIFIILLLIPISAEAKKTVTLFYHFPEAKSLAYEACTICGPIYVDYKILPNQFDALWDAQTHTITINANAQPSEGSRICSLMFELHNAKSTPKLQAVNDLAYARQINQRQYVEMIERIEHQNALSTSRFLQQAIALGHYPQEAAWPIEPNFNKHFAIQRKMGHSAWLARQYHYTIKKRQIKI